jgi:hypothetical protein
MEKVFRLIILAILAGAVLMAVFFIARLLFRLLIIGAAVLAILALVRAWNRGSADG